MGTQSNRLKSPRLIPTMIRFFDTGGHDAGTGLYKDIPGAEYLIEDKSRLRVLLIDDGPKQDRPLPALNTLRSSW